MLTLVSHGSTTSSSTSASDSSPASICIPPLRVKKTGRKRSLLEGALPLAHAPVGTDGCVTVPLSVAALPCRPGRPPNRGVSLPQGAGLLGLHLSLCFLGSLLARLALYCRRASASRPGPPLRCGWLRLGLARGRTAAAAAGGPGGWRARHCPGCHPRPAWGALRAPAGRPPRSGSQRGQEGVPGGPRCRHCACRGTGGAHACRTRRGRGLANRVGAACPHTPRRSLRSAVGRMVFYWPGWVLPGTGGGRVLLPPDRQPWRRGTWRWPAPGSRTRL